MSNEAIQSAKGRKIKLPLQITFFGALMLFAIIYILKDDPLSTFKLLSGAKILPLCLSVFFIFLTLCLDGMNITLLAKLYNEKYKYHQGIVNVCIGQIIGVFVKTGASIIQAYTFAKQEIKSAQAASILTMNYLLFQFSLFLYSLVMVIFGYSFVKDVPIHLLGGIPLSVISILALLIQCAILFSIFSLGFWRGFHRFFLNTGINFLSKIHFVRNPEETRQKMTLQFVTYRIEMKRLFQHKKLVLIILFSNLLKRFLLGIIPYMIFWSLNTDMSMLSFQASLFGTGYVNTISSLVTVGAPEVMFQSTFSFFLQGMENASSLASAANLLWRSITFYLLFLVGLLCFLFYRGAPKKYQLLSNTSTIYDFELENLNYADEKTQAYLDDVKFTKQAPLLSKREVKESFKNIKENIIEDIPFEKEEDIDDSLKETLEAQRAHLAKLEQEAAIEIERQKPDKEIQKETDKEIRFQKKKMLKKEMKKKIQKQKKEEKNRKRLERMQPEGTFIKENNDLSIEFISNCKVTEIDLFQNEKEDRK